MMICKIKHEKIRSEHGGKREQLDYVMVISVYIRIFRKHILKNTGKLKSAVVCFIYDQV